MAPGELSAPISWGLLLLVGRIGRLVNFLDLLPHPVWFSLTRCVFSGCVGCALVGRGSAKAASVLGVWVSRGSSGSIWGAYWGGISASVVWENQESFIH